MNLKKNISVLLSVLLVFTGIPIIVNSEAELKELIISDCTSGWSYSGNSSINYTADGTDGKALEVSSAYGALRKLSYTGTDISLAEYDILSFDIFAKNNTGEDVFRKILSSYSDSFQLILTDLSGASFTYPLEALSITAAGSGWYNVTAPVNAAAKAVDIEYIGTFAMAALQTVSFDETLPTVKYRIDTLKAQKKNTATPEITGVQLSEDENSVRFLGSVDKKEYEQLKKQSIDMEFGFIAVNKTHFTGEILNLESCTNEPVSSLPYAYVSDKMYFSDDYPGKLMFTFTAFGFNEELKRGDEMAVRAYIKSKSDSGIEETRYSSDDLCGGYTVTRDEISSVTASDKALLELNKINKIPDTTPEIQVQPIKDEDKRPRVAGKPYSVELEYDDGMGLCIAIYNVVEDFAAPVNNPSLDSSAAIQNALNAAAVKGGGTVYIPKGNYYCKTPLIIPNGVTLRGEWQNPENNVPASGGTILIAQTGDISQCTQSFIGLKTGGGFRNVTIIYPQSLNNPALEFSSTISEISGNGNGNNSYTVMNTTILGGSVGYDATVSWTELHYLKNVYISNFGFGVKMNNITDTGRLENLNIKSDYLINNAFYPLTNGQKAEFLNIIRQKAVGLYIQRSDWEYVYELNLKGLNKGILLDEYIDIEDNNRLRGSNGQMFGIEITDCVTGIDVAYTNAIGYALTDVNISGNCTYGIRFSEKYLSAFEITNLRVSGNVAMPILMESRKNGKLSVTNSVFENWDSDKYAVTVTAGNISLQQCEFKQSQKHVLVSDIGGAASVLGCRFEGGISDIKRPSGRQDYVLVDNTYLNLPESVYKHQYRKTIPTPTSMYVYNVADYGAVSGKNSTSAFKNALAAARKTGGTVYVPKGEYYVYEPLIVPSGVELRGVYDVPTHPVTRGSVICTNYGKNAESGAAFISLEESSGINGISLYYTEQSFTNFIPYSWTVQSLGKNCWAINTVFVNSYNALDFGTNPSDGHYINYVSGSPLRRGIFAGNNESNGWIENVQFNPHYWKRARISGMDLTDSTLLNDALNYSLESIILGDNASEHILGTFGFAGESVLVFISQGKGGTNGVIIGHGSDGCRNAVRVHEMDSVAMLNSELVSMSFTHDMHHILLEKTNTGTLALFNTAAWSHPLTSSMKISGGNLIVCQLFYYGMENTTNIAEVTCGTLYMSSSMIPIKDTQFIVGENSHIRLIGNLLKQTSSQLPPAGRGNVTASEKLGAFSELLSWWV